MKILYRSIAKNNPKADAVALIEASRLFTAGTAEEREFLNSLSKEEWTPIPDKLIGYTTAQNFYSYAKLPE